MFLADLGKSHIGPECHILASSIVAFSVVLDSSILPHIHSQKLYCVVSRDYRFCPMSFAVPTCAKATGLISLTRVGHQTFGNGDKKCF